MSIHGLYESIITESLNQELEELDSDKLSIKRRKLHPAEAGDRLALHLGKVVISALSSVNDKDRVDVGVKLARNLINSINTAIAKAEVHEDQVLSSKEVLTSVLSLNPDGSIPAITEPLTPLLDTTLLTNAKGEPRVGSQILSEIQSADRIDVVMAFIRKSGIRPFLEYLRGHCERGSTKHKLRFLTTTYTGATELEALTMLQDLGAEIKVSYDTSAARLHAKAWHFHRDSGASTAYIGSSNLTYSAQESGVEWNVRISGIRNPDVIRKMTSMFDAYWFGSDFRDFDAEEFERETRVERTTGPSIILSPVEL